VDARTTTLKTDNGDKMQEKETLDERLPALFEPDTLLPFILRGDAPKASARRRKRLI